MDEPVHQGLTMRTRRLVAALLVTVLALAGCGGTPGKRAAPERRARPTSAAPGAVPAPFAARRLDDRGAMYPRAVRLRDGRIVVGVAASSGGGVTDIARFYASDDAGRTFRPLSEISDPTAGQGRGSCCGSLLELPRPLGAQPAGTLLWAGTFGMKNRAPGRRPEIRVWRSVDGGRSWTYLASPVVAPEGTPWDEGLWEPELAIDAQGRIVCYYSDETRSGHDQVIAEVVSADGGATWGSATTVVATGRHDRPGMPVVARLPSGGYFMVYEICGSSASTSCRVHYRRSADGWSWGDPGDEGTVARTADGDYLYHAPTVAWAPGGGPDGRLLLVGGLVRDAEGALARPASGSTVLVSTENGYGRWYEMPAPVAVPFSSDPDESEIVCANYSSSLLPLEGGHVLLEVATERAKDGGCHAYVGAASLDAGPAAPDDGTYRLRNARSGLCLDAGGPGGALVQLPCDDRRPRQRWTLGRDAGTGVLWLRNAETKGCAAAGCQGLSLVRVAGSSYTVAGRADGRCLEVTEGAQDSGAAVRAWTCNDREPQIWGFERRR
jgi:hypothetical protein